MPTTLLMSDEVNLTSEEELPIEKVPKKKMEDKILTNFFEDFNQRKSENPFGIDRIIHGISEKKQTWFDADCIVCFIDLDTLYLLNVVWF